MEKKMESPIVSVEFRVCGVEGMEKKNGNYYIGLYRDYYEDPFLHSKLTKGQKVQAWGLGIYELGCRDVGCTAM